MKNPTAAMLVIGNEILSGRVQDANVNYLARRLADCGIDLREVRVVRDEPEAVKQALNALRGHDGEGYGTVFTSGGIGPTHDDITMPSVAEALELPLVRNAEVAERLKLALAGRATEATYRMAEYPEGAHLVPNTETVAPGCIIQNVVVCAGIPRIFQAMVEAALPLLQRGAPVHTRSVDAWVGESRLAEGLARIQAQFTTARGGEELDIGSYPFRSNGRNGTTLVARGTDAAAVEQAYALMKRLVEEVGAVAA